MQPSMFNVRVPLEGRDDVFLMNTLTDAQLIVEQRVAALLDRLAAGDVGLDAEELGAVATLAEHGFVVESRERDRRNLDEFFSSFRESDDQLRVTVLTTLQCNFACDYCIQGDHGEYNRHAAKMSVESAARLVAWAESQLDAIRPRTFALTFFGGEPLLNLPVLYYLAEHLHGTCVSRGVRMTITIITNGLLLTREIVERLAPFGLSGIKVTLDGDRDTHNRMRPLRGGQGTFDRIVNNVRQVADICRVSIGGNFDESSVDSYPALLDFLRQQDFADRLVKVAFKPIIREAEPTPAKGFIPLTPVGAAGKPLGGTCMTSAGTATSACDSCGLLDDKMSFLREETKRRGFPTVDGVHMGPCEIHKKHAHTVGPDGSLYACPGFAGEAAQSTGHVDGRRDDRRTAAAERFARLAPWEECRDCAFIPVCAGGCTTAAHTELHDMTRPNCHKRSFEAGVMALARDAARELEAAAE